MLFVIPNPLILSKDKGPEYPDSPRDLTSQNFLKSWQQITSVEAEHRNKNLEVTTVKQFIDKDESFVVKAFHTVGRRLVFIEVNHIKERSYFLGEIWPKYYEAR